MAKPKGETLIEVIAALTALVLAGTAAVTVIVSTYQNTALSREYLIAQNLAREAVEGVSNIRDTNWLLYPAEMDQCWMVVTSEECPPGAGMAPTDMGRYTVERKSNGQYQMKLEGNGSDDDLDLESDRIAAAAYRLWANDGVYQHDSSGAEGTIWYRQVTLEQTDGVIPMTEKIKVTVLVQWDKAPEVGKYEISTILTNYAK
jgi:hypothetical protein